MPPRFWRVSVAHLVSGLAGRQHHQQTPQTVAVRQLRETAAFGIAAKAVEGTEGHVFLVGQPPWRMPQPGASQADQALK